MPARPDIPTPNALARAAAERAARENYGKLVAFLASRGRDVAGAEDALADAFAAALVRLAGPRRPGQSGGLARHGGAAEAGRRRPPPPERRTRSTSLMALIAEEIETVQNEAIPDRRLALMFACAHPAIDEWVRAPLILQTILGLDAAAIASAFLVSPAAMGQRLARAKAKIRLAGVPFRIPERDEAPERLGAVLEAIYAAFAHGWDEAFADDPRGRDLSGEAIWLGRLIVSLAPDEPEARGLLALMLYADARRAARRNALGRYVPLSEQDCSLWDASAIDEAERLLRVASGANAPGRFQLEAAVQSAHVARRSTGVTDWEAIGHLYDALYRLTGSPVVAVNRAAAVAQTRGAEGGSGATRRRGRRQARGLRALLGRAGGPQRQGRRRRGREKGLRDRHRPADRPGGARLPGRPPRRAGVSVARRSGEPGPRRRRPAAGAMQPESSAAGGSAPTPVPRLFEPVLCLFGAC